MKARLVLFALWVLPLACVATSRQPLEPTEAGVQEAQLCTPAEIKAVADFLDLPQLEWISGDGEPGDSALVTAACKVNPVAPRQTIVAVAYDADNEDGKALTIVLLDNVRQRVLASYRGDIGEDAMMRVETGSLWIDTADYALAQGVRAFAVDEISGYSPNCGDGGIGPSRYLYVREGKRIRPVLNAFGMSYWEFIRRGADRCNSPADPDAPTVIGNTDLSLAVAPTSSHGYHDLLVTARFSRDDGKLVHEYFANSPCGPRFHYLLHYDGKEYSTRGWESSFFCGDRLAPSAIVVKAAIAEAATKAAPFRFLPSMQVRVLDSRPGALLVQRDVGPAGWLPREAVVPPYAFMPLRSWRGPATLYAVSENFGVMGTYQVRPDGSYTLTFPRMPATPLSGSHYSGRLSAYGTVVVADRGPSGAVYFWQQADGRLCALDRAGKCESP
ncbi:MAG: hypothetical protein ACTHL5_09350 [Rhodanobacter sp.]